MMQTSKMKIYIIIAVLILAVTVVLVTVTQKKTSPTWQEQYDLGMRYLSEGNYQEAIIAFTAAIEINEKHPEAYLKAAEAYKAIGDGEAAKAILKKGYAATGDKSLQVGEESPVGQTESVIQENNSIMYNLLEKGATNNMVRFEEVNFLGRGIENLDIETMKNLMIQNGLRISEYGETHDDEYWWITSDSIGTEYGATISALQNNDNDYVSLWGYTHYTASLDKLPLPIGVRSIKTQDTLESVLTQLGFSNASEISNYIRDISTVPYNSLEEISQLYRELEYDVWEPETKMSTRFMFTGNGGCAVLDDGTYMPSAFEFEVAFFPNNGRSYRLTFRFEDTNFPQFSDRLCIYNVNVW